MKLGDAADGWILVKCEACGRPFPTRMWNPYPRESPDHFFCTDNCLVSGEVAEVAEAEAYAEVARRYQRGDPLVAILKVHGISTGTLYRILHGHGIKSNRHERGE